MVIWIAAVMLVSAVALFVAAPLADYIVGARGAGVGPEPEGRAREQALAIQALRELEFDYAMGKLDMADYRALRKRLENRALAAMGTRQDSTHHSLPIDAEQLAGSTAALRAVQVSFCSQCGSRFARAHNSCPSCGAACTAVPGQIR